MKINKIFLSFLMILLIPNFVHADDGFLTIELMEQDYYRASDVTDVRATGLPSDGYIYNNFNKFYDDSKNANIFDNLYMDIMEEYNKNYKSDYPFYRMSVMIYSSSSSSFKLHSVFLRLSSCNTETSSCNQKVLYTSYILGTYLSVTDQVNIDSGSYSFSYNDALRSMAGQNLPFVIGFNKSSTYYYLPLLNFESNFDYLLTGTTTVYKVYKGSDLYATYEAGDVIPTYRQPGEVGTIDSYVTVDLSKYYAVILSLKDYSKTDPFSSHLKVKGSIGITPVNNFGRKRADYQDYVCSNRFPDFTDYPFYVLSKNLDNNSVFYIKPCSTNSSFKYDKNVFNVTYVTEENKDDPVVSINGKDYHVIPFEDLDWSANENEENGVIPGESVGFNPNTTMWNKFFDSLSSGLNSFSNFLGTLVSSIGDFFGLVANAVTSVIGSLTSMLDLCTQVFNSFPPELKAISIASFSVSAFLLVFRLFHR